MRYLYPTYTLELIYSTLLSKYSTYSIPRTYFAVYMHALYEYMLYFIPWAMHGAYYELRILYLLLCIVCIYTLLLPLDYYAVCIAQYE